MAVEVIVRPSATSARTVSSACRAKGASTWTSSHVQTSLNHSDPSTKGEPQVSFAATLSLQAFRARTPISCTPERTVRSRGRRASWHPRARAEVPDFLPSTWTKAKGPDQLGPTLELTGEGAVLLQLACLQNNDSPYPDYGVEVMYRFASFDPFERSRYFGPRLDLGQFERFRRLFHHSTYRVLLGHKEHHVLSSVYVSPDKLRQRVRVLGLRPREDEVFEFTVVQREGGSWDGYWFTESLIHDGEGVSRGIAY